MRNGHDRRAIDPRGTRGVWNAAVAHAGERAVAGGASQSRLQALVVETRDGFRRSEDRRRVRSCLVVDARHRLVRHVDVAAPRGARMNEDPRATEAKMARYSHFCPPPLERRPIETRLTAARGAREEDCAVEREHDVGASDTVCSHPPGGAGAYGERSDRATRFEDHDTLFAPADFEAEHELCAIRCHETLPFAALPTRRNESCLWAIQRRARRAAACTQEGIR